MEVKKVSTSDLASPLRPSLVERGGLGNASNVSDSGSTKGSPFAETLSKVQAPELKKSGLLSGGGGQKNPMGVAAIQAAALKFSNHAVDRMRTRGITFSPEDMGRLNEAVVRAASKGSKDSLILMNDSALIVNVKSGTVVTVMDKNALKENVFTNIDSTIVM